MSSFRDERGTAGRPDRAVGQAPALRAGFREIQVRTVGRALCTGIRAFRGTAAVRSVRAAGVGARREPYRPEPAYFPIPVENQGLRAAGPGLHRTGCAQDSDTGASAGRNPSVSPLRRPARGPAIRALLATLAAAVLLSGCMNGGILRAAAPTPVPTVVPTASPASAEDPRPLLFPRDEAPHDRLTEWWYYTGHLQTDEGRRFGFEFVIFRAERGDYPVAWASHYAITDPTAGSFTYRQRSEFGPQVDRSQAGGGFDLAVSVPAGLTGDGDAPWTMSGGSGRDHFSAGMPGYVIELDLSTARPPVLHDGDGWLDLGPAGGTYYYSRTRMDVAGTISLADAPGGAPLPVTGLAWFDHQWGDFIAVGAGGWDWFSVQLEDGRDLTISRVHGPGGVEILRYGTLVAADGSFRHLAADEIRITVLGRWQSPRSGADYPTVWQVELPGEDLELHLAPTLADQELDTTSSTGVIYWEGQVTVTGADADGPVGGLGYVELTGYAK